MQCNDNHSHSFNRFRNCHSIIRLKSRSENQSQRYFKFECITNDWKSIEITNNKKRTSDCRFVIQTFKKNIEKRKSITKISWFECTANDKKNIEITNENLNANQHSIICLFIYRFQNIKLSIKFLRYKLR